MKLFDRESRRQVAYILSFALFFSPVLSMASMPELNKSPGLSIASTLVTASLVKNHISRSLLSRAPRPPQTTFQAPLPYPPVSIGSPLPRDITTAGDITVGGFLNVSQNGIRLFEDPVNGTNSVTLKAAADMPMDYTLRFPASAPTGDQYLAADVNGTMFWTSGGGGAGNIVDGGNSFGHDIVIGSNDNFGMSFKTNNINRITLANNGVITAHPLVGVSDRYVTASSSGLLTATMPTGVKDVIQVIKDVPVVDGKYYNTLKDAVDWANAHATEITVISIAGGTHVVDSTIAVTSTFVRGIVGVSTGGTVLVPGPGLAGSPLLELVQDLGSDVFTVQDLSIDGFANPAYISTPGSAGIRITGTANFGLVNILAQGCFRNVVIDGESDISQLQTVVLNSCVLLGAGDCGLLLDNGAFASASNLIVYGAGNNLVRAQCTNAASPMTELTLVAAWLTDLVPGTADGLLVRDNSYVLLQSSRIYDVQNGVVAEGLGQIKSMGNVRIKGEVTHYKQVDGSAKIQVIGDFVDGAQNSQFGIVNPNNVYFDILDIATNMRKSGRLVDESYLIDAVLTGHEDKDPVYQYVSNWFGFKGDGIELSEEVLAGATGVTGLSTWNSSAYNSSLIRGLQAHTKDAGLILATYASDGDPRTPDYSKARSWRLIKRANDHAFTMINFNGAAYSMPLILTATGNLGLGASAPVSRLELGSGQISVPAGDAVFPSYSFTGDLNTGVFSPALDSVALTTDGLARVVVAPSGSVTLSSLGSGVVHSSATGLLTSSLIGNSDIADGSITNAKLATPVTSSNTPSSIVMRDASGSFSAGIITANLNGNATTATSAGSFSGVLAGQVTGPQNLTVVAAVDGKTAAEIGSAVTDVQNATSSASLSTLVKRDASGNFSAGTITATLLGNVTGNVSGSATNFTGNLLGDVTGTQVATVVSMVGGVSAANVASGVTAANAATSTNTPSTIVTRDGSGNFSAGTITANLTGAASLNVLKVGDTMTGNLTMSNQQQVRLAEATPGTNYVALQAPSPLGLTYTLTMPVSAGTNGYVLTTNGSGVLSWQPAGSAAGYFINGGNSFAGNASLGTNDVFPLALKTSGINRLSLAASGAITIPAFAGSGERYVSTDTTGTLESTLPVGTKNVIYVVKDHPIVPGKYYATIEGAVDWANANAVEPTTIWLESGYFTVTSTIDITNPMIRAVRGESIGGSIVVPDLLLVGHPVFSLSANYGFNTFSIQDLSINGAVTPGYMTTPGGVGILVTGVANFGMLNILTQGCYRGFEIDGDPAFPGGQISVLTSCYALLSGDCGILVDNGAFVTATELVAAWSSNQQVRVQRTNAAALMTEFTAIASWLTDDVAGTGDGLLAKDVSKVLLESSRVYDVQNAIVAAGNAHIASLGNLRLAGVVTNYKQIDGTAVMQASGDLVEDAAPSKFSITDANNVYFDIIDRAGNVRKIGNTTNDNVAIFSVLTGAGAGDPWYGYKKDWFGYRGELFEMPEAAMVGSSGNAGRALCTVNNDALLVSFVRGLQAHDKEAGLLLATYASNGDPATPDYSLSRAWQLFKNPFGNGTLTFTSFNGSIWQSPFSLTMDGNLGLSSEIPSTRLEVGSGQVSAPSGNAVAPTYTFLSNLNTGLYSPGLGSVALSSNGLASLIAQASGIITIPNLAPTAGVVHNDASGNLSSSLIVNNDISASAAIADTKLATIATAGKVSNSATTANTGNVNDPVTIVARDSSGNFTANMITANVTGDLTGNVSGTSAGFTGSLSGDVTGTQGATHVAFVNGQSAVNVSAATIAANAATSSNTPSTIVKRDASGNFSADIISATNFSGPLTGNVTGNVSGSAASFTGSLLGDVTGTQGATHVALVGGETFTNVALATQAANAATDVNTASTIVKRDGSGNFIAGTITAALTGAASANVLKAGDTMTGALTMSNQQQVRLAEATPGTNYVAMQAPSPLGSSYTLTMPASAGTNGYVLATNGSGVLSWQPAGSAAGYFINGGNNFGGVGPAVLGTTAASGYGLNLISNGNQAISLSNTGTVLIPSLVGTGDRIVQVDATGTISATLPTGTKNVVYVVKNSPTITGKYYPTLNAAVAWANANAVEQTAIVVAPGSHLITATVAVTNPLVTAIIGQGIAATRLVVDPAVVGSPVLTLSQTTDAFSLQDIVIDATGVPAFKTTPGSVGLYISGSAYYDVNNILVQGCYQGMFVDGLTALPYETIALINSFILLSGDCGLLIDNGGYVFGNNVTISYSGNQDIRAQSTNVGAQRTQVSLAASWLGDDPIAGTADGILVKDNAYALISSSRVYFVKNAFVAAGSGQINTVGNPRVEGMVTHYKQVDGTAQMEALGDVVTGATPDKFSVADSANVYFDGFDTVAEEPYSGRMTNTTYNLSKILTGNGANDPFYRYVKNWFGFTGHGIELSEAVLGGLSGVQTIVTHNNNSYTSSFIRGLSAHAYTAGLVLGTYASDGDPTTPDWSLGRSWRLEKRPVDHAFQLKRWDGSNYLTPLVVTSGGNLGLDSTGVLVNPVSQLELGSGQISVPAGNAPAPSYSFTGDLNTGLFSTGADAVALSTNGLARLCVGATGTITIPTFIAAGIVHNDASGNLSSSLIVNNDISGSAAIADSKLATIATALKVSNSATTATSANTASAIVARDGSGNFSAGTITASLTGAASDNVLKAGDTMMGNLTMSNQKQVRFTELNPGTNYAALQAPASVTSSYTLTLPTTSGTSGYVLTTDGANPATLSWSPIGSAAGYFINGGNSFGADATMGTNDGFDLNIETNSITRVQISGATGEVSVPAFTTAGVLHNATLTGLLSSSLITNADVDPAAGIIDTKLATIVTAGKVSNSATTATIANTPDTIVLRDLVTGNFAAGTISANLVGNVTGSVTGAASLNVLKTGDTMTGALTLSGGTSNLTVGGTSYLQAAQTAGLLSVNNGVYFLNGVPCLAKNILQVTKGTISGPNQFNSVKAAVDSIVGNTATNPFVVQVGPGLFIEDTITLKPYVAVIGDSGYTSLIYVNDPSKNVIVGVPDAILKNVWIQGATNSGSAGIVYHGGVGGLSIEGCVFADNDILINVDDATAPYTFVTIEFSTILPYLSSTTGIKVRGSTRSVTVQVDGFTWAAVGNPILNSVLDISGTRVIFAGQGMDLGTLGTGMVAGAGCTISNGATINVQASSFHGFTTGIDVTSVGTGPSLTFAADLGHNNTNDIIVSNPLATGTINGVFDRTKISIDPSANLSVFFSDSTNTGTVTSGPMYLGSTYPQITNVSKQIEHGANLGLLSGGVFDEAIGVLQADIAAGDGYAMVGISPNDYLKYVTWGAQTVTLTANADNFLYIDNAGVAHSSTSAPDPATTILLGKMRTNGAGEVFCERMAESMQHTASELDYSWREALGPVYASGSIVSKNGTVQLDVTQGRYFYGTIEYNPSAGTAVSWKAFYTSGASGNYVAVDQSNVDYAQYNYYDSGSGLWSLAAIPGDKFARHSFYVVNDGVNQYYLLVYGQTVYDTLLDAQNGSIPPAPATWTGNMALIASFIVKNDLTTPANYISEIRDERPRLGFKASGVSVVTVHGDLQGLLADDHPQYVLTNGGRVMTGNLQLGGNSITNVNLVDGVDVSAHAFRHQPGGADPLLVAAPVTISTANSEGILTTLSRSDHVHDHGNLVGGTLHAVATANPGGTAGFMSAADKTLLDSINPALYVQKAGDTMTGTLAFNATGLNALVVNTNKFIVDNDTGNTTIAGTLDVTGATTLTNLASVNSGIVHASTTGLLSKSYIVDADVDPAAGIVDTKLATIATAGKVSNSATTATIANTPDTIVLRDLVTGNFAAGTISAVGVDVSDKTITLNKGGILGSGTLSGIQVEEAGTPAAGYFRTGAGGTSWRLKAPASVGEVVITPGAGGFTINQGSHNPVTIGVTPNGLSLATQVLSLALSGAGTTGALSSSDWNLFDSKQAGSATLTALSSYNTNGLMTQTAPNTFTGRTIVGASVNQVLVADGDGVGGNPTLSLPQNIHTGATPTFEGMTLAATPQAQLRLQEDSGNGALYVALQAPALVTPASYTLTLPAAVGSINQVLAATDGAGTLGWVTNLPGYVLMGGNTAGGLMSIGTIDNYGLTLKTNNTDRLQISNAGTVTIPNLSTVGIVHNAAGGLLSTSLIVNADIAAGAAITDTKLATISTAGKVANGATTAISAPANPNTIVLRDGSGNFTANVITASLTGNVMGNVSGSATSFSGPLVGDVTGNQGATVVAKVGGVLAANVASGANAANAATNLNTPSTIVLRDGGGNFTAGTITASLTGHASLDLPLTGGILSGSLTMNNVPIVLQNGLGNTVTVQVPAAGLSNYALTLPTTSGTSGYVLTTDGANPVTLTWQPTGAGAGYFVNGGNAFGGGTTTLGTIDSNNLNIVTGTAGPNTRISISSSGTIAIPAFTTAGIVHNAVTTGNLSSSLIVDGDITVGIIANNKLVTLTASGLVANSATTATHLNTASTIVARDASGNFNASTILLENQGQLQLQQPTVGGSDTVNLRAPATLTGGSYTLTLPLATGTTGYALITDGSGNLSWSAFAPAGSYFTQGGNAFGATAVLGTTDSNALNLVTGGASNNRLTISSTGTIAIPAFSTAGVVHNAGGTGNLSSSLIVDGDIMVGTIANNKLVTLTASGLVANSATTATNVNTASAIVARDGSGNFNAHNIVYENQGQVQLRENTGNGTNYVALQAPALLTSGTYTLTLPAVVGLTNQVLAATNGTGTLGWVTNLPGYVLMGGNTAGGLMSIGTIDNYGLTLKTNNTDRLQISNAGTVTIPNLSTVGVVHNAAGGLLSTSLIVNADIDPTAAIVDTKLATISTAGKVANSATTAISAPANANTIVLRDGSGNFTANVITASLTGNVTGNVTGSASLNVLKAGDTMTGPLTMNSQQQIRLRDIANANSAALEAPDSLGASYVLKLPTSVGTAGYVLTTDGANPALLSWSPMGSAAGYFINGGNSFGSTASLGTNDLNNLLFKTNNTTHMIIDSAGKFGIGQATVDANYTLAATGDLVVQGGSGTSTLIGLTKGTTQWALAAETAGSTNTFSVRNVAGGLPGTARMTIDNTGVVNKTTFYTGMQVSMLNTVGVVHTDASGNFSTSTVTNADIDAAAGIVDTKLATISTAGKVSNSATTATSANTASAIVARDASGNFSAGTITAALTGHASLDLPLTGGTLTGTLAINVGAGNALVVNTNKFIVDNTTGNTTIAGILGVTGATTLSSLGLGIVHSSGAGLLSSSLIVNADVDPAAAIVDTKLATIATAGKVSNSATTATSVNTASAIVARDASGNFSAGTITASLTGHASLDLPLTGGALSGSLTMSNVPLILANGLANTVSLAAPATLTNYTLTFPTTAGTNGYALTTNGSGTLSWTNLAPAGSYFVNGGNSFGGAASLGTNDGYDLSFKTNNVARLGISGATGVISIPAFATAGVVHNAVTTGNLSSSLIVNADVDPAAAIADTKLATIATALKVSNSATTATSTNTVNAIVSRDASGNFSAGTVSATFLGNLTGSVTGAASLNVLKAGDTMSGNLIMSNQQQVRLSELTINGNNYIALRAPASVTADTVLTLPDGAGTNNYFLKTDGTGILSWADAAVTTNAFVQNGNAFGATAVLGTTDAHALNLVTGGAGNNRLTISSAGTIAIPAFATAGIVHNAVTTGNLSSSLIVNADVDPAAAIVDTKLATISTAGKVSNSATTATNLDTANAIVARDASGNFSAGTITASLTGHASLDLPLTGGALSGSLTMSNVPLILANGSANTVSFAVPAALTNYTLTFPTTAGTNGYALTTNGSGTLSWTSLAPAGNYFVQGGNAFGATAVLGTTDAHALNLVTGGAGNNRLTISSAGTIAIPAFATAGILHNAVTTGILTSSLIVNADVDPAAAIVDTKLATIATAGKVSNSATTATNLNTASAIVARDASGSFSVHNITLENQGQLQLREATAGGTNVVNVQAPAALAADYTLTLPTTAGTSGYVLSTDGTGVLSWTSASVANAFVNGGNSFGGVASLGTNDTNNLLFKTNNVTRMTLSSSGETLFTDKLLTINNGGAVSSGSGAGLEIEENSVITGSAKTSSDRVSWEFIAPAQSYKAILSPRGASFMGLTVGSSNFFMGANVGNATVSGTQNVGVGHTAMTVCSSGYNQTALGYGALNAATTTYDNTAIGCGALAATTNQGNTAVGAFALNALTNAGYNTAVGDWALRYSISGWNNIGIGYLAGQNFGTYDSGNIVIGNQGVNGDNNVIRLGTSGTHSSCYLAGVNGVTVTGGAPVYINSSGQLGTGTSLGTAFVNGGNSFGATATLGTNDTNDLLFRTNNTNRMIIDSAGKVAIGQSTVDPDFGIRLNSDTLLAGAGAAGNTYLGLQQGTSLWGLEVDTTGGINTFTIRDATTSGILGNVRVEIDTEGNTTTSTNYKMAAYRATPNQVIGIATAIIIFNTELFDPGLDYNNATGRYTAPYTGYYLVAPNVTVLSTGTLGNRTLQLYRGGVAIPGYSVQNYFASGAGRNFLMSATWLLYMAADDIIDVRLTGLNGNDAIVFNQSSLQIHYMSFTPV